MPPRRTRRRAPPERRERRGGGICFFFWRGAERGKREERGEKRGEKRGVERERERKLFLSSWKHVCWASLLRRAETPSEVAHLKNHAERPLLSLPPPHNLPTRPRYRADELTGAILGTKGSWSNERDRGNRINFLTLWRRFLQLRRESHGVDFFALSFFQLAAAGTKVPAIKKTALQGSSRHACSLEGTRNGLRDEEDDRKESVNR
jgi:hypothetical protein